MGIFRHIILLPLYRENILPTTYHGKSTVKNTLEFCALISNTNIHIAYLILHPIRVSRDLEIQPNLIETIWKWELKFKVVKWFQHDCF